MNPTPRQLEVLRLVSLGHPNKQIADRLGVCMQTVDKHVCAIEQLAGVHDRVSLIRQAIKRGWLSVAEWLKE